ncbi:hypothetical protein Aple_034080 [Acrocarpospora pleiomorpha]|uniref:Uncharacterized protein n=1 Tax=Acrocarpospora pleiomorpha TaxID=90975 RepID=A0A5M3XIB8_9ACTN|nr:hypothetical protein Aple_034080 [Acrocarpospora pleiomorpha]
MPVDREAFVAGRAEVGLQLLDVGAVGHAERQRAPGGAGAVHEPDPAPARLIQRAAAGHDRPESGQPGDRPARPPHLVVAFVGQRAVDLATLRDVGADHLGGAGGDGRELSILISPWASTVGSGKFGAPFARRHWASSRNTARPADGLGELTAPGSAFAAQAARNGMSSSGAAR